MADDAAPLETDPTETEPTTNSTGVPVDSTRLDEIEEEGEERPDR